MECYVFYAIWVLCFWRFLVRFNSHIPLFSAAAYVPQQLARDGDAYEQLLIAKQTSRIGNSHNASTFTMQPYNKILDTCNNNNRNINIKTDVILGMNGSHQDQQTTSLVQVQAESQNGGSGNQGGKTANQTDMNGIIGNEIWAKQQAFVNDGMKRMNELQKKNTNDVINKGNWQFTEPYTLSGPYGEYEKWPCIMSCQEHRMRTTMPDGHNMVAVKESYGREMTQTYARERREPTGNSTLVYPAAHKEGVNVYKEEKHKP